MSYDLTLYKSNKGFPDLSEAEELEAEAVNNEEIAVTSPDFEGSSYFVHDIPCLPILNKMSRELETEEAEITSEDRIVLRFPYHHTGADAEAFFAKIKIYLEELADCGGYFVYDPQIGKAFDPKETAFDWVDMYEKGAQMMEEISSEEF